MAIGERAKAPRPAPVLTDDNEGFWLAAQDGRLSIQRCQQCGRFNHPPRPMCPNCHSLDLVWEEVSGDGEVYSFAILHHPQHPAFDYPVRAVLIDLDEGVRVVSNLVDVAPEGIYIGMRVTVAFEPTADDFVVPVFRPRPEEGERDVPTAER